MKNPIFIIILLAISSLGFDLVASPLYEQLVALNKQWECAPSQLIQQLPVMTITDHEDLISAHLQFVEHELRSRNTDALDPDQRMARVEALDILHSYWQEGVYPQNLYHQFVIPYFIDDFGTACAVGHLMRETDGAALANQVANEMNNAYIEDMPYTGLAV